MKEELGADWARWSERYDRVEGRQMIAYKDGYKYQLAQDCIIFTPITPAREIDTDFIRLGTDGMLWIKKGYAWNGASGPAIDTRNFMRGSLVHDALYQLMGEHGLDIGHRDTADRLLREICKEDGMSSLRAWWVYMGVKGWGGVYVSRRSPVLYAP